MASASVYHLAEIDQMIERLRADLRDISERAASAAGSATEERLADMLSTQERRLHDLLAAREEIVAKGGRDDYVESQPGGPRDDLMDRPNKAPGTRKAG